MREERGGFCTKGTASSFISSDPDREVFAKVQIRFEVDIPEIPDEVDMSSYMSS